MYGIVMIQRVWESRSEGESERMLELPRVIRHFAIDPLDL
jgi:hypothetical protein